MGDESFSIIKIRAILLVTMPADPDDVMVMAIQEQVLRDMQRYQARGVILDISAVDTLDSFFARTLAETAQMVALLGGHTVMAGMRPSVAITVTQLGLRLGSTLTALNADRALDMLSNSPDKE